jgi:hypothetical protein
MDEIEKKIDPEREARRAKINELLVKMGGEPIEHWKGDDYRRN